MVSRRLTTFLAGLLLLLPLPGAGLAQEEPPAPAVWEVEPQPPPPQVAPVALKIPVLGVDASVYPVGEDPEGAMDVPPDPDSVAWWSLGAGTGVPGNVVLAAHVDWGGRLRVFGSLRHLGPGDEVIIIDEALREFRYQVVWNQAIAAEGAPVEEIFANSDVPEVTLITCGGAFDPTTRQYLDRIIVRAVQI